MIHWDEVTQALEDGALDDGILDPDVADAVLLKDMHDRGRPLDLLEVGQSCLYPLGGPQWPWQNPAAIRILADEPGFDLYTLITRLPIEIRPSILDIRARQIDDDVHARHPGQHGYHFSQKVHGNKPGDIRYFEKGRGTLADPYITNDPVAADLARAAGKVVVFMEPGA